VKVRLRPGRLPDTNFVVANWLHTASSSSQLKRSAVEPLRKAIDRIMHHPRTRVTMAVNAETSEDRRGCAVVTGDVLHFIYVKGEDRGCGLGCEMLAPLEQVRAWWWTRNLGHLKKVNVRLDPLALLEF